MKFIFLITIISLLTTGCKKDSDSSSNNNGLFTAVVDGKPWTAMSTSATGIRRYNNSGIVGIASDSSTIVITILEKVYPGTYVLGNSSMGAGEFMITAQGNTSSWSTFNGSNNGSITFTSIDTTLKKMTGTFHFTAFNGSDNSTRTITSGVFTDLTFDDATVNNTFSCEIDGIPFMPYSYYGSAHFGNLHISAVDLGGSTSIELNMTDSISAGTYSLDGSTQADAQYNPNTSIYQPSVSGNLIISLHDTVNNIIEGTFDFIAEPPSGPPPSNHITNGAFTIYY